MTYKRLSSVHPELFHYTSEKGLFAILETQYLRATNWQYLNDSKELVHFHDELFNLFMAEFEQRAIKVASQEGKQWLIDQGGVDVFSKKVAKTITELMYKPLSSKSESEKLFEFYVTSFCTSEGACTEARNHGLLSQWRYYGREGGYALVFDTAELEHLMELEHLKWDCRLSCGEVGYSCDSPETLAKRIDAIPKLREVIQNCQFNSQEEFEPFLEPFIDCCIHFKHWAFSEEKEVRFVATLNSQRMIEEHKLAGSAVTERPRNHFKNRDNCSVPCIHLFEGLEVDRNCLLPILRIIVGPGLNQKNREKNLKSVLQDTGYNIEVTCSDIPIRY